MSVCWGIDEVEPEMLVIDQQDHLVVLRRDDDGKWSTLLALDELGHVV